MPIPDYESLLLPVLKFAEDSAEHSLDEAVDALGRIFGVTEEERRQVLKSGRPKFKNRIEWARSYLRQAVLVENPGPGRFRITPRGKEVLRRNPPSVDNEFLMQFPEFRVFIERSSRGRG